MHETAGTSTQSAFARLPPPLASPPSSWRHACHFAVTQAAGSSAES